MPEFVLNELSQRYTKIEHQPIDIRAYAAGNTGIPYVWRFEAMASGPNVVVCGIMHGNEIAGAAILRNLIETEPRPSRGKVTYCFGNPDAFQRFDQKHPYMNRYLDQDLNRVWGRELSDRSIQSAEVRRARELKDLIASADYLLDIHTMQGRGQPVALTHDKPAALKFVSQMTSIPFVLTGKMHQPDRLRLRDYGDFGDHGDSSVAIQVQAGQHWERDAVEDGLKIAKEFLHVSGVMELNHCSPAKHKQKQLKIIDTIIPEGGVFEYAQDFQNGAFFAQRGSLLGYAGPARDEVRTPVDNCYFIMPVHFRTSGGSCGRFAVEI